MLSALIREIFPPKDNRVEVLFSTSDKWTRINNDDVEPWRRAAENDLLDLGLIEQRLWAGIKKDHEAGELVASGLFAGSGKDWGHKVRLSLEARARRLSPTAHLCLVVAQEYEIRRTEAGRMITVYGSGAKWPEQEAAPNWRQESATSTAPAGFAVAVASASIGDINVTCQPQIIVNQPAPVVNVTVHSAAGQPLASRAKPKKDDENSGNLRTLVLSAVAGMHGYSEDGLDRDESFTLPEIVATVNLGRKIEEHFDKGSVSRTLKELFGGSGHRGYEAACKENRLLKELRGHMEEAPEYRHYQEHRQQDD